MKRYITIQPIGPTGEKWFAWFGAPEYDEACASVLGRPWSRYRHHPEGLIGWEMTRDELLMVLEQMNFTDIDLRETPI